MARWHEVAQALREAITAGAYAPGTKIPTEGQLEQRFGCSRTTIRRAIAQLTTEGLVLPVRKGGTTVREQPERHPLALDTHAYRDELGYYFSSAVQGLRPVEPPTVSEGPCPPDVVHLLGLRTGDPVIIRDRLMGNPETGQVVQLATSYLPTDLAAGTVLAEPDTGPGGIYDRMEGELGWGPLSWQGVISSRPATADEGRLLGLAPGVPVLAIARTAIATAGIAEGRVVEVNVTRRDASRFEVRYPVTRATRVAGK
ncbi:GntR family transcriptional regulator [Nonomuraea sp. MG754425]|uniref:GntR family transcriptional regulator n=1 Tax=Nonomuraea sp. MG754425 TaxID=2570319 RepID=UPI001F1ECC76|nr:GntR family transcriptional regulator [Nonomuraea sp. MG754425]MCF6468826.1 GntR family transcriptional regulator [Nonomuraea sp. MG754425]